MRKCSQHGTFLVFRTGESEKGKWQRWSCPHKDGDTYCKEGEWATGKTPAEEMTNLLGKIAYLLAKADAFRDMPIPASAAEVDIKAEDIPF